LKDAKDHFFPNFQVRLQVVSGRGPVTEPDHLDFIVEVDLCTGQDVKERARFLGQYDDMATEAIVGGAMGA
jgi:hypothetical protein